MSTLARSNSTGNIDDIPMMGEAASTRTNTMVTSGFLTGFRSHIP